MKDRSSQQDTYGWKLTVICFCTGFFELGTFKSFGVFILHIQESLDCSIGEVGTAMAASHTTCYVLVPLVNILTEKYGPRRLVIGGGAVMLLSFLAISFVQNVGQFALFIVVWGLGVCMAFIPPLVSQLIHYRGKLAIPVGIGATGSALGMMVYPPLTESLIEIYGWRGTMIILAAVNANVCVFGALLKPPSAEYVTLHCDHSRHEETPLIGMTKSDILWTRCNDACITGLLKFLSMDVLREEPKFSVYAFVTFLVGIMYSAWMIYLVPHAMVRDIESQHAAFLSTAGGIGTLVGRIIYGPILHLEYITSVQMYISLALAKCGAFMLDPVIAGNYSGLVVLAVVNGFSLGTMPPLFPNISEQILQTVPCHRGLASLCFFFALGELAGGSFAGFAYQIIGSYEVIFLMLGALSAMGAVIIAVERLITNCCICAMCDLAGVK